MKGDALSSGSILTQLDKESEILYWTQDGKQKREAERSNLTYQRRKQLPPAPTSRRNADHRKNQPAHYFRIDERSWHCSGYFTSEIGMTAGTPLVEAPGRYDPCVPYKPGKKAWAPHAWMLERASLISNAAVTGDHSTLSVGQPVDFSNSLVGTTCGEASTEKESSPSIPFSRRLTLEEKAGQLNPALWTRS